MLRHVFFQGASLALEHLKESLIKDAPPEQIDDVNYGFFADSVARNTNMHPAICLATYADIEPFINKAQHISIHDLSKKIKERAHAISYEARLESLKRHNLMGQPTSNLTRNSTEVIMNKLPASLNYLRGRAEIPIQNRIFTA